MKTKLAVILIFSLLIFCQTEPQQWQTVYERSKGLETPDMQQTYDFYQRLVDASPYAHMSVLGTTPEKRDLRVVVLSRDKCFSADKAHQSGKPVILLNCCIHPGESAGKDAVMMLARDLLIKKQVPQLLDSLILAIIPIMNPDGHERMSPYNRINQKGPLKAGWRVTARRLNLNRDFMKAESEEMQAFLKWFHRWNPHVFYDLHTTNGQDFQYVITYKVDTHPRYGGPLSQWVKERFLPHIKRQSRKQDLIIGPYAGPLEPLHPEKGLMGGVWVPRLSNYYATLCNSVGFLVEAHSLKTYAERVQGTYELVRIGLQYLATHPGELMQSVEQTRRWSAGFGKAGDRLKSYGIDFDTRTDRGDSMVFKGYKMETVKGEISGKEYIRYLDQKRDVPTVLFDDIEIKQSITAPLGYIIPKAWTPLAERLQRHGILQKELSRSCKNEFECYRFENVNFANRSYEGKQRVNYSVHTFKDSLSFQAGSIFIPLGNEKSRLIMHLLEPYAPDALLRWGVMNTIFEQKEYFETYAMEPIAQQMARNHPRLEAAFEHKVKTDPEFANSARQRLFFFYKRSPYYDKNLNVYPVVRVIHPIEETCFE